jgi:hypothetical protein
VLPRTLQSFLAAAVPALIATFGLVSIRVAIRESRARWLLAAGVLAMLHGALTLANLSVQGGVPFSSGSTGWGPRSVAVDFLAYLAGVGAALSWAVGAISSHQPDALAALRRPVLFAVAIGLAVVVAFFLLETFG